MDPDTEKWNARYREVPAVPGPPAAVLSENLHLLPAQGCALDLACGLGANALLLARNGFDTYAWDKAEVAITKLRVLAAGLPLHAQVRDVIRHPPELGRFDVIVVSRFLDRSVAPHLAAALRPGGLLFYQTFTRVRADDSGPANADFRLADGEMMRLFIGLRLRVYREEGTIGDITRGLRNQAMLVAQRPEDAEDTTP
ncbi:MAG: class I SAM-dependent methyltransferase [Acidiferrobacterales bacterium]